MPLTLLRLGMDSLRELATEVGVPYDGADKEGLRERLLAEATRRNWSETDLLTGGPPTPGDAAGGVAVLPPPPVAPAAAAPVAHMLPLQPPGPFDMAESGRERRWDAFKKDFKVYLDALGPMAAAQQRALFLHAAGSDFIRFAETLVMTDQSQLEALLTAATAKFSPIDSQLYESFKLGEMAQRTGEGVDDFVTRLRQQAKRCSFRCSACQADHQDDRILEILMRSTSLVRLRQRVFERGMVTLDAVLTVARTMETADSHAREMAGASGKAAAESAHHAESSGAAAGRKWKRKPRRAAATGQTAPAGRVEGAGRSSNVASRPTAGFSNVGRAKETRACFGCGKVGHLRKDCREASNFLAAGPHQSAEEFSLFSLGRKQVFGDLKVDGVVRRFQLDTGSSCNVIPESFVPKFKRRNMEAAADIKTYGANQSLTPLGVVVLAIAVPGAVPERVVRRRFFVVLDDAGPPLLGLGLCTELGFIRLNSEFVRAVAVNPGAMVGPAAHSPLKKGESGAAKAAASALGQPAAITELINEHRELFGTDLPGVKGVLAHVALKKEAVPRFVRARHVPLALRDKAKEALGLMVDRGTLTAVKTARFASPVVNVGKPNGDLRICADYTTTLDGQFDIEAYPLPRPEDLFAQMSGGVIFSKLDLRTAYEQFELDEESQEILTINTLCGLFKPLRLPYGVSSAPAIVQRAMEQILDGLDVQVFLDDILVRSSSLAEHVVLLRQVLERLRAARIRLKREKCEFGRSSVKYLGFVVSAAGQSVDPERTRAITDMRPPTDVSTLRTYLGVVQFYGKFVSGLADMAAPLHKLLKKEAVWQWNEEEAEAFKRINGALVSAPTLRHFDPALTLVLSADAGPEGLGAVLAHRDADGAEWPIGFASRSPVNKIISTFRFTCC